VNRIFASLLTLCFVPVGCTRSAESNRADHGDERRTAVLASFASGNGTFLVPDTVPAGKPFEVVFHTSGNSCVEQGKPQIERLADRTIIAAYDVKVETPPVTVCQDFEQIFRHAVTLRSDAAGESTLEFHGYGDGRVPVVHRYEVVAR
jgi:poly(3-hydroxybutyrate) depolymerase